MKKNFYCVPSIKVMNVDLGSFMAGSAADMVGETGAENMPFL